MIATSLRLAGIASLLLLAACSPYLTISSPNHVARTLAASEGAGALPKALNTAATGLEVGMVQAPICQASQTCAGLDAEQIPLSCVKKVPYTNVLIPRGTTFQVQDPSGDFVCLDTGVVVNGKEVISCHGKELYSFQLQLTNPSCTGATLATGTGQCDDGFGYDASQKCCTPVSSASAGSTIVTVNLGACPLPNP